MSTSNPPIPNPLLSTSISSSTPPPPRRNSFKLRSKPSKGALIKDRISDMWHNNNGKTVAGSAQEIDPLLSPSLDGETGDREDPLLGQSSPSNQNRLLNLKRQATLQSSSPQLESGGGGGGGEGKPPIPPLPLLPISELQRTPLPIVPMIVLCICMIGEFLSASVSGPFLFFMIESFFKASLASGEDPPEGLESRVGFWAGIVSSVFFLSQFLTSLLWASISDRYGRRAVLFCSLVGNSITLILFGMSKSLTYAIIIRLLQGVFNGSIGVARGAIKDITDSSNEGSAYSIVGFAWGMGGIVGPIIGGVFESPVKKFPSMFPDSSIFLTYPYLLPCIVAACVTGTGAVLSLFLGYDGGLRSGAIRLEDEEERGETVVGEDIVNGETGGVKITDEPLPSNTARRLSNASSRVAQSFRKLTFLSPTIEGLRRGSVSTVDSGRTVRTGGGFRPYGIGNAYGYDLRARSRRGTGSRSRRGTDLSALGNVNEDGEQPKEGGLNFAQRLLLANEGAVFSIADVWLEAATQRTDAEGWEPWDEEVFEEEETGDEGEGRDYFEIGSPGRIGSPIQGRKPSTPSSLPPGPSTPPQRKSSSRSFLQDRPSSPSPLRFGLPTNAVGAPGRKYSTASSTVPAIFANTGLRDGPVNFSTQVGILERRNSGDTNLGGGIRPSSPTPYPPPPPPQDQPVSIGHTLEVIREEVISVLPSSRIPASDLDQLAEKEAEAEGGMIKLLPIALIVQWAVVALHSTSCDQLFTMFLVTPVPSGGLGLTAQHYAGLVAIITFFQMIFQFRFYPTVGPPRGSLSHLNMFRLGLILYIPAYLLFPELRGLLRETSTSLVMFGMVLLVALRTLGNVCAYTSVMVLTNAMTPPHLVAFANGLAQAGVSAARFIGPVLGGSLWSYSISEPIGVRPYALSYPFGFFVVGAICFVGLVHSYWIK